MEGVRYMELKNSQWHGIFGMNTANDFAQNNFSFIESRTKFGKCNLL